MMYQIRKDETDEVVVEFYSQEEAWEMLKELGMSDHYIHEAISCRGCDKEGQEQEDAHGISTGYWCHECYESDRYPYRRDRYPTIETHGYGERLNNDY
jgi:hypothetical protein